MSWFTSYQGKCSECPNPIPLRFERQRKRHAARKTCGDACALARKLRLQSERREITRERRKLGLPRLPEEAKPRSERARIVWREKRARARRR